MKVKFIKIGYPLYCDAGPQEGDMRIDLTIKLYLSPDEYARYHGSESLHMSLNDNGSVRRRTGNTAEPSGELSVGDTVTVGEVALAVAPAAGNPSAAGWPKSAWTSTAPIRSRLLPAARGDETTGQPQATPSRPARIAAGGPDGLDIPAWRSVHRGRPRSRPPNWRAGWARAATRWFVSDEQDQVVMRMDKYTMAVTSIPCPRESCTAALGQVCNTTAVVHEERRNAALAQGLWDPGRALAGEYGDLAGCPLEALKPAGIRRGRPPARPRE